MADNSLTAAELKQIGERVNDLRGFEKVPAERDRARLHAALERLIEVLIEHQPGDWSGLDWQVLGHRRKTKDAAIDALLSQGGGSR